MARLLTSLALTALLLAGLAGPAAAADRSDKPITIGADAALVVPLGDWSDVASVGIGFLGRFEFALKQIPLILTGRVGFIGHFATERGGLDYRTNEVPILAGVRWFAYKDLYVASEIGIVHMKQVVKGSNFQGQVGSFSVSDSRINPGFTAAVGYLWNRLDFQLAMFLPDVGDAFGLVFQVGYNFVRL